MNKRTTFGRSAAALAIAAMCTASTASAQLSDTATSCRASVAKSYGKLVKTAVKTIAACHKSRDKGDETLTNVDCNDVTAADAAKGKYASAVTKHISSVNNACGTDSDGLLTAANNIDKEWYISCPVTCPGVASPIETMEDVATCQGCEVAATVGAVAAATLGLPAQDLSSEEAKCHGAISKGYGKFVDAALKNDTSCQSTADKADENDYTLCEDAVDTKGKVGGAQTKAEEGLDAACIGVDLSSLDSCASDMAGLKACNATAWGDGEDTAYDYIYEMPTLICPRAIRTTIRGGCSTQGTDPGNCSVGYATGTVLSVGWKGLAHRVDVTDMYTLAGDITCPGELGSCGDCTINGISYDNVQYPDFARCRNNSAIKCDNPFGTDPTHCGGTFECEYYLGPPLAVSAGGTPTCTLNVVEQNITGTANPDNGTSDLLVRLNSIVHTGDSLSRPCPICRSWDPLNPEIPQDGVKNGKCLGGANDTAACDIQGFDLSFAPTDPAEPRSGVSLDCPPSDGQSIGTLKINLPLTTGTSTKDAVDPCESPYQSQSCFCGVCSGDTSISCDSDANCAGICVGGLSAGNSCVSNVNCPGACTGGFNNGGSCTSNSACTSACSGGTNPGALCTSNGNCTGTCSGGFNDGQNCATNASCSDSCVGGSNSGAACTTNANCTGTCAGGADAGEACASDATCSDACSGGSNDGTACTTDGDCTGTCTGGSNSGATCSDNSTCTNACLGGDNDGTLCVDDTACTGGGTCTDIGSCASIGTCSNDGTCGSFGTCSNDGTCGGQGTCSNTGTCTGTGSCSGSLGVCGAGNPPGVNRRPNNCSDSICNPVLGQTDRGQCIGSDVEKYCDGLLMANGKGVMGCSTNASCAANVSDSENQDDWVCPGNDCGLCTVSQVRSCFMDPIVITGTPDTENPILVGAFCLPPSANGSVNAVSGSPGPGVVQTDAIVEKRY